MNNQTIEYVRADFEKITNRSLSMPIAGAIAWSAILITGLMLPLRLQIYSVLFMTGTIFPIALVVSKIRKEDVFNRTNPFSRLMGSCVVMVNLLWALHIPLLFNFPQFVPLSIAVALGLHWIVYSWIIQNPVGMIHSITRAILCVALWYMVPEFRVSAVAGAVVFCYLVSIIFMTKRKISFA